MVNYVEIDGVRYGISPRAINRYLEDYGIEKFDEECAGHIRDQLQAHLRGDAKVVIDLAFKLSGTTITFMAMKKDPKTATPLEHRVID